MNQKAKQKKTLQKKSVTKPKTDWRKQIVSDIEKAIKAAGIKNPKTEKFAIGYPARLVEGKQWKEVLDDKILWKMMKEKWPGLWGFSSSRRCSCEVLKGESGKSILELIPIGIVRHTKKPCKTAVDLMKTDMESCAESDKKLESAGIKKPMRDIYKDDCCYGCSFAIETKDENMGPFDRRYKCNGFSRILNPIATAYQLVKNVSGFKIERDYDQKSKTWSMKWEEALEGLLKAQQVLLVAASIIGERANGKPIDCVDSKEKPLCYYGGSLEDFLTK